MALVFAAAPDLRGFFKQHWAGVVDVSERPAEILDAVAAALQKHESHSGVVESPCPHFAAPCGGADGAPECRRRAAVRAVARAAHAAPLGLGQDGPVD